MEKVCIGFVGDSDDMKRIFEDSFEYDVLIFDFWYKDYIFNISFFSGR